MNIRANWIKNLPPGEYTIHDLKELTGLVSNVSIKIVMMRYGARVKSARIPGTNIFRDVFIWKGMPKYLRGKSNMKIEGKKI